MIPRDGGSGATHSSAKPTRSISAPSLSTPTRHPVRKGYSRSPVPTLSSSQRADRTRTAGRRSAIAARENWKSLHPPSTSTHHPVRKGYSRSPLPTLSSSQRADRTRTAGRRSAIAARENRKSLSQPGLSSSQRADRTRTAGRRSAFAARENWKSLHPQKPQAELLKGAAIGVSVASRQSSRSHSSTHSSSSSPLPTTWAERERLLGRVDKPSRNPAREAAKGRIADTVWKDHLERRPDVNKVVSQPTWRDPHTGKQMTFPDAKSRRPDFLVRQRNGTNHAVEIKATPAAAESSSAAKQRVRDRIALQRGGVLGKGEGPHVKISHATIRTGLPILGPGGNTALPGETQRHVIIKPRSEPTATKLNHPRIPSAARGLGESTARGVTRGVLRGASRAAMPVAAAIDAYDLTKTYQNGGNTPEFRSKAAGVAGGWGGAAAGAAIGTAVIPIPVVGTVVGGAVGYLVGSGAASELEEGVEKAAPKVWEGAKSAWHGIFG
jgi:hypothetical protein